MLELLHILLQEKLLIAFPNNRINVEIKQSGDTGMRALKEILRLLDQYNAYVTNMQSDSVRGNPNIGALPS